MMVFLIDRKFYDNYMLRRFEEREKSAKQTRQQNNHTRLKNFTITRRIMHESSAASKSICYRESGISHHRNQRRSFLFFREPLNNGCRCAEPRESFTWQLAEFSENRTITVLGRGKASRIGPTNIYFKNSRREFVMRNFEQYTTMKNTIQSNKMLLKFSFLIWIDVRNDRLQKYSRIAYSIRSKMNFVKTHDNIFCIESRSAILTQWFLQNKIA
jgi:hypothetical protein